jgi:CubicO group peptidase (beta-lactamase class C family)
VDRSPAEGDRVVTLQRKRDGRFVETPNPAAFAVPPRGDGRLFSTAADYGRFLQMILHDGQLGGARLLNAETVREMGRNQTGINNTFFWIDPQAGIGAVVLMQFLPFYDEAALGVVRGVECRVYQHLQPAED